MQLNHSHRYFKFILVLVLVIIGTTSATIQAQSDGTPTLPLSYKLDTSRLRWEKQGYNNCGPTTMTIALSYFGYTLNQQPAVNFMKPHSEDKNVNPWEMTAFVNEQVAQNLNIRALYRPAGDMQLLKTLLANEFPVIIEEGYQPAGYDWMGHYLLLIGYDDTAQIFFAYDSFAGHNNFQGRQEHYAEFEANWWHFNNTFIVLYPPEREDYLLTLLGDRADMVSAYQIAFNTAQGRASENTDDNWAWYNAGEALTVLGYYPQATDFFTVAFDIGMPWRTLWYRHTPFEAYYYTGKFKTVLQLVQSSKQTTIYVEEFYYWHGMILASQGYNTDARIQFDQAIVHNKHHQPTQDRLTELDTGTFIATQQTDSN